MSSLQLDVGGQTVEVSRPDKVLFPEDGITKADLARYYQRVADLMLPHVEGRAVAMQRFPDGLAGQGFFHKETPEHFPDFVRRKRLGKEGDGTTYVVIDNPATLVFLADQACITPHTWLSRVDRPHHPDRMVFDLDPGAEDLDLLRGTARRLRELLEELELPRFPKSTGSKGLHVEVPLDRSASFDEVRDFARAVATVLAEADPDQVTTEQRKAKRAGRLFIDTYRNGYGQTAVPPYAVRALAGAPVAVPLDWGEALAGGFHPRRYTLANVFRRLGRKQDPWAGMAHVATPLDKAQRKLEER
jgi:bifunctional non-homologous end joining protein LigD